MAQPSNLKIGTRPLIIYGSHLGGTLATSLALNECKSSKNVPYNIAGLIARDAVYDWTHLATSLEAPPISSLTISPDTKISDPQAALLSLPWTSQLLHGVIPHLFAAPASAFDSFASPLLFFRTPSVTVPRSQSFLSNSKDSGVPLSSSSSSLLSSTAAGIDSLSVSDAEYAALRSAEFDNQPPTISGTIDSKNGTEAEIELVRSSNVKFPPKDSGLKIPRSLFLVSRASVSGEGRTVTAAAAAAAATKSKGKGKKRQVGGEGEADEERVVLAEQAQEMVKLMRRSVVLHEFRERVQWDEDADPVSAGAERVQSFVLDNVLEEEDIVREWLEG